MLAVSHLTGKAAGDTCIVQEIMGKIDKCILRMEEVLFLVEGVCILKRGRKQARRNSWAACSRPRCPWTPVSRLRLGLGRGGQPTASFESSAHLAQTPLSPASSERWGNHVVFSSALPKTLRLLPVGRCPRCGLRDHLLCLDLGLSISLRLQCWLLAGQSDFVVQRPQNLAPLPTSQGN